MDFSMKNFPSYSHSCAPSMDCNTCVQYSFCVFIVLLNGSEVCANRAELRDNKYSFETTLFLFSFKDCVSHLILQNSDPGSKADLGLQTSSSKESQKLIPSLMKEQTQTGIEDVHLKKQVPDPKTEILDLPANDPGSMKKPPDCPMTIQNSAKIVPESTEAFQNPMKDIQETTKNLAPDLNSKVENLENYRRSKSKVILPLNTVRDGLLKDYCAISKPPKQPGEALIIQMKLFLNSLTVNETGSKFNINGVLVLEWFDRRLSFPETIEIESEMPNNVLNVVYYEFDEIWHPEFTFDDGTNDVKLERHLIHSNSPGLVSMEVILNITLDCQLNMLHWPYDTQTCRVTATMNSFTEKNPTQLYFLKKVFQSKVDNLQLENYTPNPEWNLVDASVKRTVIPCKVWNCSDHVIKVDFIFKIKRNVTRLTSIHSCLLAYSILMITWMLLCQVFSDRKTFLIVYNLSSTALVLVVTGLSVPVFTKGITVHGLILILNVIVILYSIIIGVIIGIWYNQRPPGILRRVASVPAAVVYVVNGFLPQNNNNELNFGGGAQRAISNQQWKHIAKFLDIAVCWTYASIIMVLILFRDFRHIISLLGTGNTKQLFF